MNKNILIVVILLLIVGAGTFLIIGNRTHDATSTIRIGAALGLSGDAAAWGEASLNGSKLAVDQINKAGGVNGKKLELVIEDTGSSSQGTVSAVSKLQNIDHVDAFLVTWLDVYQGAEALVPPGKLMISPDAGIEAVNGVQMHPGVYSTWYRTQAKSNVMVHYMAEHGQKKLFLLTQDDSYYTTADEFMKEAAKKYGVQIMGEERMGTNADIKTTLAKIAAEKPDAIFFASYDEATEVEFLRRRASLLGSGVAVYGDEFIDQNYARTDLSGLFENIYFYAPQKPGAAFVGEYEKTYGKDPVFGAGPAYDAVHIVAQALKDKPADLNTYMHSTTFDTVSYGKVAFDALGGVTTTENYFVMKQIQNGVSTDAP